VRGYLELNCTVHNLMCWLVSWGAGKKNVCRYSTTFYIRGVGTGELLAGVVSSARAGFVQK